MAQMQRRNEIDPRTLAQAKRKIARLRKQCGLGFTGFLAVISLILIAALAKEHLARAVSPEFAWSFGEKLAMAFPVLVLASILCWVVGVAAQVALWRFRCPRCGLRPDQPDFGGSPRTICHRCYLDLEGRFPQSRRDQGGSGLANATSADLNQGP